MPSTAKLDNLIALNEEILAIAKARVPVAQELLTAARQMPQGASMLARLIGNDMEKGMTLDQAVAAQGTHVPGFYSAVVAAGVRSGRLPSALEGLSSALIRLNLLRRRVMLAFLYPAVIVSLAWVLLVLAAQYLTPSMEWTGLDRPAQIAALRVEPSAAWFLALSVPAAVLLLGLVHWVLSGRAGRSFSTGMWLIDWLPGVRAVCRQTAYANFTELLQLLVAHRTPLPDSLRLASEAVGWKKLSAPAGKLAAELEQGRQLSSDTPALSKMPPLVRLALLTGDTPQRASRSLWHAARTYHDRAATALGNLTLFLPAAATATVGGAAVLLYSMLVLGPYFKMLYQLAY